MTLSIPFHWSAKDLQALVLPIFMMATGIRKWGRFSFCMGGKLSKLSADRKSVEKFSITHSKSYGRFLKADVGNQI